MSPDVYRRVGAKSAVVRDPFGEDEALAAYRAMIACPTGSIRLERGDPLVKKALADLPHALDPARLPGVYHVGYHSEKSYGATPWFVVREGGNILVDSPRFSEQLARKLEAMGGIDILFLTHQDDVADHQRWKERFPRLRRIIHDADVRPGTAGVEEKLDASTTTGTLADTGLATWQLAPDLTVVHTPGHTAGCISLHYAPDGSDSSGDVATKRGENVLFTGDHLAFSLRLGRLDGFAYVNRYGMRRQAESIAALATEELDFLWLLPGHGCYFRFDSDDERRRQIAEAAENFRKEA
ncbi:unnamed protein product [Phaeothamnion confervicola]